MRVEKIRIGQVVRFTDEGIKVLREGMNNQAKRWRGKVIGKVLGTDLIRISWHLPHRLKDNSKPIRVDLISSKFVTKVRP